METKFALSSDSMSDLNATATSMESLFIVDLDATKTWKSPSSAALPQSSISEDNENTTILVDLIKETLFGQNDSSSGNETTMELPIEMQFNDGHLVSIVVYSCLFIFSAVGNLSVLALILRRRRHHRSPISRIDFMLLHLAIADLMVTFLMMPLEVAWASTVSWHGGDLLCRVMAFFRIFGLFLSSFVLVCLAIDRFMAVKYPMQIMGSVRRGKIMIGIAWILSVICSFPQMVIFHVKTHPHFQWYTQCVTFDSFPTPQHELAYFVFGMLMTYALPFVIIAILYCGIVVELYKRTRESSLSRNQTDGLRRSGIGNLGKAKVKTLKMTVAIVAIFFVCWTPYYVMCLWYWIDKSSALGIDQRIQKALYLFACTNSTFNPVVYGIFNLKSAFGRQEHEYRCGYSRESVYRPTQSCVYMNENSSNEAGQPMTMILRPVVSNSSSSSNHNHNSHKENQNKAFRMTSPRSPGSLVSNSTIVLHPSIVSVHPLHRINSRSAGSLKYSHTKLNTSSLRDTHQSNFC